MNEPELMPKTELSLQQIGVLLQVVNNAQFAGADVELIANIKGTLVQMHEAKRAEQPVIRAIGGGSES